MDQIAIDTVNKLRAQYQTLDAQTQDIVDGKSNLDDAGKTVFFTALQQAHDNLVVAITNGLMQDDAAWQQIGSVIDATQNSLDNALKDLTSLAGNLNKVTNAISTVTQVLAILK